MDQVTDARRLSLDVGPVDRTAERPSLLQLTILFKLSGIEAVIGPYELQPPQDILWLPLCFYSDALSPSTHPVRHITSEELEPVDP